MTDTATSDPLPCARRAFRTEAEADAEIRSIRARLGLSHRSYKCHCGAWHMTKRAPISKRARRQRRA